MCGCQALAHTTPTIGNLHITFDCPQINLYFRIHRQVVSEHSLPQQVPKSAMLELPCEMHSSTPNRVAKMVQVLMENNPHTSGSAQSKPVLVKGYLYIQMLNPPRVSPIGILNRYVRNNFPFFPFRYARTVSSFCVNANFIICMAWAKSLAVSSHVQFSKPFDMNLESDHLPPDTAALARLASSPGRPRWRETSQVQGVWESFRSTVTPHVVLESWFWRHPHACAGCGTAVGAPLSLVLHQEIDTQEKPYECHECGKSFCLNCSLIVHQGIYGGQKPYRYKEYGKFFSQHS